MGIEGIAGAGHSEAVRAKLLGARQDDRAAQTGQDFKSVLKEGLNEVNSRIKSGDQSVEKMIKSQGSNLHETMVALGKADISTRLTSKIGQKLVQAYKEVSRIQV